MYKEDLALNNLQWLITIKRQDDHLEPIYLSFYLANTPAQAESHQYCLERAAGGIGLHVNVDKTECMCFNQRGNISTQKGGPLKPLDKFIYLGCSVSSTEKGMNSRLAKEQECCELY